MLPSETFYKDLSVECLRSQLAVDLYIAGNTYMDVASLSTYHHHHHHRTGPISRYTAGRVHYYPNFDAIHGDSGIQLRSDLVYRLTQPQAWETVFRVRFSKGMLDCSRTFHDDRYHRVDIPWIVLY